MDKRRLNEFHFLIQKIYICMKTGTVAPENSLKNIYILIRKQSFNRKFEVALNLQSYKKISSSIRKNQNLIKKKQKITKTICFHKHKNSQNFIRTRRASQENTQFYQKIQIFRKFHLKNLVLSKKKIKRKMQNLIRKSGVRQKMQNFMKHARFHQFYLKK